jgi:hypothetical protein
MGETADREACNSKAQHRTQKEGRVPNTTVTHDPRAQTVWPHSLMIPGTVVIKQC